MFFKLIIDNISVENKLEIAELKSYVVISFGRRKMEDGNDLIVFIYFKYKRESKKEKGRYSSLFSLVIKSLTT